MKSTLFVFLAACLCSCSLAPRIQPASHAELVGAYCATFHANILDSLYLNDDSSYVRRFQSFDSVMYEDHGKWSLHLLGSRLGSPYVKIEFQPFITRFNEDPSRFGSPFDPVQGGVADSIPLPREARIWKDVNGAHVTIRLGDHYKAAWMREYSK